MSENGWRNWCGLVSPYDHEMVEVTRSDWPAPELVEPHKLDPLTNVAGLLWRPLEPLKLPTSRTEDHP